MTRVPVHRLAAALRAPRSVFVIKAASEQRYVLGVAFAAGRRDDMAVGEDGRRDWMSPVEVEKAAWGFAQTREVGIQHADGTTGAATVCESYVYRGPNWTLTDTAGRTQVVKAGDWLVGAILSPESWQMYQTGQIEGWSAQGSARYARRP